MSVKDPLRDSDSLKGPFTDLSSLKGPFPDLGRRACTGVQVNPKKLADHNASQDAGIAGQ